MLGLAAFLVRENPVLVELRVHGQACGQGQGGAGDALADGRHEVQTLHQSADGSGGQGVAGSHGVRRVYVNGVVAVEDCEATGALSGTVLRSGRDTDTVATS